MISMISYMRFEVERRAEGEFLLVFGRGGAHLCYSVGHGAGPSYLASNAGCRKVCVIEGIRITIANMDV